MIFEVADLRVLEGRNSDFETAFAEHSKSFMRFPGFVSHELMRQIGTNSYRLFAVFGNDYEASVWLEFKTDFEAWLGLFLRESVEFEAFKRVHLRNTQESVLEVAMLNVIPGRESEFELAFKQASKIISSMNGFVHLQLQRCLERPNAYVLLVNWETLEDHTVGFRQSPEYQQWRALLHHFYDPFPTVEHFESVNLE
jgi:heme-degrading monooxygenase HmoA